MCEITLKVEAIYLAHRPVRNIFAGSLFESNLGALTPGRARDGTFQDDPVNSCANSLTLFGCVSKTWARHKSALSFFFYCIIRQSEGRFRDQRHFKVFTRRQLPGSAEEPLTPPPPSQRATPWRCTFASRSQ